MMQAMFEVLVHVNEYYNEWRVYDQYWHLSCTWNIQEVIKDLKTILMANSIAT